MTPPSSPKIEHTKEVRFAVVMYGGVSLAIYINGIAQELLSLVRSTAEAYDAGGINRSLSGELVQPNDDAVTTAQKLRGTERAYRKLSYLLSDPDLLRRYKESLSGSAQTQLSQTPDLLDEYLVNGKGKGPEPITTGFVVDILSGTSAGGINAIFLAKALANNQSIEKLKQLWVQEGDIGLLINDKQSLAGLHLQNQDPPKSLLNSRRMYLQLLKAFDGMDATKPSTPGYQSPYVKELDLFVTTTDIKGTIVPLQLSDKVVYEKRHRNVFHLKYGTEVEFGQECNHFLRKYNPFLAFAARCTSSFPFAFEPMRICDLDPLLTAFGDADYQASGGLQSELWKPFFRENIDVVFDAHNQGGAGTLDFTTRVKRRSYGDGGYLDNKPFSYATESLSHRQSTVPIERKLIYIEPSPEHPEDEKQDDTPPNVLQNAKAALLDLPTYETIREDLQRILQRNRTFHRIASIVEATNEDLDRNGRLQRRYKFNSDQWRLLDMAAMVKYCGIYFLPYRRLRIASATDELTALIARIKNIDERSDNFVAVRALLRAWRIEHYVEDYDKANTELLERILDDDKEVEGQKPSQQTLNAFLDDFDFTYRFRRLNFVLGKIDSLIRLAEGEAESSSDEAGISDKEARELIAEVGSDNALVLLRYMRCELSEVHKTLRTALRKLQSRPPGDAARQTPKPISKLISPDLDRAIADFYGAFTELKLDQTQLTFILGVPGDVSRDGTIGLAAGAHKEFAQLDEKKTKARAKDLYQKDATLNGIINTFGSKLRSILGEMIILPTSAYSKQLLHPDRELPEPLSLSCVDPKIVAIPEESKKKLRAYIREYYIHFDDYDQILFPILYQTEFGESAEVDVFRISPEDAPSLINERGEGADGRQKLAGTSLFHFGAFLDRVWRENDIMWGRLDGAERLITGLMPDPEYGIVRDKLISDAHVAILMEEMPPATRIELSGLLAQALIRASSGQPFENAVESAVGPLKAPKVKQRLATAMRACLEDDMLLDFIQRHYEVNRELEPKPLLRSVARATQVTGKIFDDIAKARRIDSKAIQWIARAGQLFWGMVEVAVPGSLANLLMFHWLRLLYVLEILMVIGGVLFGDAHVKTLAWTLLGFTFGINLAVLLLRDVMRGKKGWLRLFAVSVLIALLVFSAIGIDNLFHLGGKEKVFGWLQSVGILPWLQGAKQWIIGLFK
jgi:patatin-related protein